MKLGKIPPVPDKYDIRGWCPMDALEADDYFPILGYKGGCPNCGTIKVPDKFWGVYVRMDGLYHVFKTMEDIPCEGCQILIENVSILCQSVIVDVTQEMQTSRREK